mmetsp:Transcript_75263/g.170389  ORF Transcript_75263/g.170389 Transcript_75263/m.170389 type:complete len:230 (-) Transcript_75263:128-817(-)
MSSLRASLCAKLPAAVSVSILKASTGDTTPGASRAYPSANAVVLLHQSALGLRGQIMAESASSGFTVPVTSRRAPQALTSGQMEPPAPSWHSTSRLNRGLLPGQFRPSAVYLWHWSWRHLLLPSVTNSSCRTGPAGIRKSFLQADVAVCLVLRFTGNSTVPPGVALCPAASPGVAWTGMQLAAKSSRWATAAPSLPRLSPCPGQALRCTPRRVGGWRPQVVLPVWADAG